VDRQIIIHKKYENDQITVLEEQMKKYNFSYFLDIGSNCGYYSCYFGERFKNLKILAFEPNTLALKKLSKSVRKNSLKNIKLYNFALSDSKKKVKMKSMIFSACLSTQMLHVKHRQTCLVSRKNI